MRSFYQLVTFAFLQILLWSSNGAEAVNLKTRKKPTNARVGVELDRDLFNAGPETYVAGAPTVRAKADANRIIFMAHWRVSGPLSDGQLVQIAMDGYLDMLENVEQYGSAVGAKAIPGVITVFHWDQEIIVASSQSKGLPLTYTRNNHILPLIMECIQPATAKSNEAKCGEMSAAQLFVHLYPNTQINTKNIVTVTVEGNKEDIKGTTMAWLTQNGIKEPCNPAHGGGCAAIVGPGKVLRREVPVGTAPAPYSKNGWTQSDTQQISFILPDDQVVHA
ncbi:hypothetical protein DPSP01_012486 [Paraphaeosphaeria sporulosa]|uniref:Uncharacterized protein n=1 Tax=Paraphaeosphaeria sporulosa TaxID=1460663 RepID=A0A177CJJ7_9PLEO|nr:uncharacterized protein CC84DRAFT_1258754 [Paraphaeosphaeria sporulosa]OAG07714.1 hypothetical protein CC84DRAFT_1258754 [Paraphaeosphaeria sporulosa]